MAGAPLGNQNESKGKRWAGALRRALHEYQDEAVRQGEALLKIAQGVVRDALAGDAAARKEIGDRLDGKAAQSVTVSGDEDNPLQSRQVIEFVHSETPEGKRLNGHGEHPDPRKA